MISSDWVVFHFHFFRLNLVAAVAAPFTTILEWPVGGLLVAADEDDGILCADTDFEDAVANGGLLAADDNSVLSPDADLDEDPATDSCRFIGLLVCLTSKVRFGDWTTPRLGLAQRGTGAGLLPGLTDLARATFAPPRSVAGVDMAALIVLGRVAALVELIDDDIESQLDTDVLAADGFRYEDMPLSGFRTMNWLPW